MRRVLSSAYFPLSQSLPLHVFVRILQIQKEFIRNRIKESNNEIKELLKDKRKVSVRQKKVFLSRGTAQKRAVQIMQDRRCGR